METTLKIVDLKIHNICKSFFIALILCIFISYLYNSNIISHTLNTTNGIIIDYTNAQDTSTIDWGEYLGNKIINN